MEKPIIEPIELTMEQRIELIALCNKTWPDLSWRFWIEDINDVDDVQETDFIGYNFQEERTRNYFRTRSLSIHWFEFVVRMAIDEERDEFMNFYLNVCSPKE